MDADKRKKYFIIINMMRITGDSTFESNEVLDRIADTDVFDDLYERIDNLPQDVIDDWLNKVGTID